MLNKYRFSCFFIGILFLSLAILTGCAKPPTEEMAKADKALQEAKQKEAPVYVPDLFAKAEGTLKKAKDYVTEKKYKEAKQVAIEAEGMAVQAVAGIEAAKTKMKTEAEQAVQDIQKALDDLKTTVASVAKKKALVKVRDEAQEMIKKWEADFTAVKEKLQGPKLKEAGDELKAMKDQIGGKKDELTNLLSAPPAPKK